MFPKNAGKNSFFGTAANHTNPYNYRRREWSSASLQLSLPLMTSPCTPLPRLVKKVQSPSIVQRSESRRTASGPSSSSQPTTASPGSCRCPYAELHARHSRSVEVPPVRSVHSERDVSRFFCRVAVSRAPPGAATVMTDDDQTSGSGRDRVVYSSTQSHLCSPPPQPGGHRRHALATFLPSPRRPPGGLHSSPSGSCSARRQTAIR